MPPIEIITELPELKIIVKESGEVFFNASFIGMIFPDEERQLRERIEAEHARDMVMVQQLMKQFPEAE